MLHRSYAVMSSLETVTHVVVQHNLNVCWQCVLSIDPAQWQGLKVQARLNYVHKKPRLFVAD